MFLFKPNLNQEIRTIQVEMIKAHASHTADVILCENLIGQVFSGNQEGDWLFGLGGWGYSCQAVSVG